MRSWERMFYTNTRSPVKSVRQALGGEGHEDPSLSGDPILEADGLALDRHLDLGFALDLRLAAHDEEDVDRMDELRCGVVRALDRHGFKCLTVARDHER